MIYYNEIDPYCGEWLKNLMAAGHIPSGDIDSRSIADVKWDDVKNYIQRHWFAGLGGWLYALKLAGWPTDRAIDSGSCPCQPFSAAGKQKGGNDPRHLWPEWYRIIRESRDSGQSSPQRIVGEQVASAIGHGWIDTVSTDLEAEGYAFGSIVLGAHSVGAFTIRQRVWFVADAKDTERRRGERGTQAGSRSEGLWRFGPSGGGAHGGLADPELHGRDQENAGDKRSETRSRSASGSLADRRSSELGNALEPGLEGHAGHGDDGDQSGRLDALTAGPIAATGAARELGDAESGGRGEFWNAPLAGNGRHPVGPGRAGPWGDIQWQPCRDGKVRPIPIEPSLHPLVARLSESVGGRGTATHRTITDEAGRPIGQEPWRIGMLRGSGNSIVPEVAAAFLRCLP